MNNSKRRKLSAKELLTKDYVDESCVVRDTVLTTAVQLTPTSLLAISQPSLMLWIKTRLSLSNISTPRHRKAHLPVPFTDLAFARSLRCQTLLQSTFGSLADGEYRLAAANIDLELIRELCTVGIERKARIMGEETSCLPSCDGHSWYV